ncbi:MAG: GNAT family N-acetyltransferase [Phycisphaerae bacterium]|nr:GNAT family N-acetyltransferase [Phycisphaerae bacterium]
MAKSKKKTSRRPPPRGMTIDAAKRRIEQLRQRPIPIADAPEDLDEPIDPALKVTKGPLKHLAELIIDGQSVSGLVIWDYRQQIGSQAVRMAGVGDVTTHDEHRFKGYMRRTLLASLRWMRKEGFDTSLLYGIPSFYPKFGYAPAFPDVRFTMNVRDAEAVPPAGHKFLDYTPKHLDAVLRIYRANNARRTGPIRRSAKSWQPFRKGLTWNSKCKVEVALDTKQILQGYWVYDISNLTATVIELGARHPSVYADLLRAAARHAWNQRLEMITFVIPEDDAFVEFCKPFGLRKHVAYQRDGAAMVRMINLPSALTNVALELGSRMHGTGRLNLQTNLDDVGLIWSRGTLTVSPPLPRAPTARLPQWAAAQLLYGYRTAKGLSDAGVLQGPAAAVDALEEMFPPTPHFNHYVDHF